jgi:pimeloyl-ACP methyl ester carboxylesterase
MIDTNGIRVHAVVEGDGPLVVLVHGWPEGWYSFRYQLDPLVQAGFRVAALDVRGYGGSDKPGAIEAYAMRELAADIAGVITGLGERSAVLVGHDWGAPIVWTTAILHRAQVRAVAGLSVPYLGRPRSPLPELYRALYPDSFFYQLYFQTPGVAERELDADVAQTLRRTYYAASGENCAGNASERGFLSQKPKQARFLDGTVDPVVLPAWLTEADLAYWAEQFRDGFGTSLHRYRNYERDFLALPELAREVITQPALFIAGELDPVLGIIPGRRLCDGMERHYADLRAKLLLPGVGHWVQQEAPDAVNTALLSFLARL